MDPDVFPNSLEYWGPTGMVFFRNVQVRWMPIDSGDTQLTLALERPGASGDRASTPTASSCRTSSARFPLPDFSGAYQLRRRAGATSQRRRHAAATSSGTTSLDDAVRPVGQRDRLGHRTSARTSSSARTTSLRLQFVVRRRHPELHERLAGRHRHRQQPGERRARRSSASRSRSSASSLFLDHTWNEQFTSAVGYSRQDIDNTDGQAPNAFKNGQYALGNLLYYAGAERDGRRRAAVGPARELLRRLPQRRLQAAVLVQVQLLVQARRLVMTRSQRIRRGRRCVARLLALALRRSALARAVGGRRPEGGRRRLREVQGPARKARTPTTFPALAKVDPNLFGIALVTADGKVYTAGDVKTEVSIQSISKVFTMAQVIQEQGLDVDREADRRRRHRRALQLDHRRRGRARRSSAPARRR